MTFPILVYIGCGDKVYMTRLRNIWWPQTGNQVLYQPSRRQGWYRTWFPVRGQQICQGLVILTESQGWYLLYRPRTSYVNFCDKSCYRSCYSQVTDLSELRYVVLDFLIDQEGYSDGVRGRDTWVGQKCSDLNVITVQFMSSLYSSNIHIYIYITDLGHM